MTLSHMEWPLSMTLSHMEWPLSMTLFHVEWPKVIPRLVTRPIFQMMQLDLRRGYSYRGAGWQVGTEGWRATLKGHDKPPGHRYYPYPHPHTPLLQQKEALLNMRRTIQQKLRLMQDSWLSNKANEIQACADRHNMKNFYAGLKEMYCPTSAWSSPLLSANGTTLITDKKHIWEGVRSILTLSEIVPPISMGKPSTACRR